VRKELLTPGRRHEYLLTCENKAVGINIQHAYQTNMFVCIYLIVNTLYISNKYTCYNLFFHFLFIISLNLRDTCSYFIKYIFHHNVLFLLNKINIFSTNICYSVDYYILRNEIILTRNYLFFLDMRWIVARIWNHNAPLDYCRETGLRTLEKT